MQEERENTFRITTQLYLPSKAKKYWGCPKISTVQRPARFVPWEGRQAGEREGERRKRRKAGARVSRGGEQRGEQSHFQLARETTRARRLQGPAFFSSSGFYHCWGTLTGGGTKRERRDPVATSVCRGHSVSPPLPLSSQAETEGRETRDSHFKRQFDVRSTQERSLKEDLRRQ